MNLENALKQLDTYLVSAIKVVREARDLGGEGEDFRQEVFLLLDQLMVTASEVRAAAALALYVQRDLELESAERLFAGSTCPEDRKGKRMYKAAFRRAKSRAIAAVAAAAAAEQELAQSEKRMREHLAEIDGG